MDQVDHALARADAAVHRGGMHAIDHAALGRRHGNRAGEPGIGQHGRVDHRLDRVIHGRKQRRVGHVDAGAELRRGVEIEPHLLAVDGDGDAEIEFAVEFRPVIAVGEAVGAVRDGGDAGAHLALGVILQRPAGGEHHVAAVAGAQRGHPLHAEPVGRHLRTQVGEALVRDLAVEQDQRLHVGLQRARAIQPDRWDAEAFLIDVLVAAIGEIGVVGGVDRPGGDGAVDEDRLGQHEVGQMGAAALERVVADEHVTGPHVGGVVPLEDVRDDADEAAEVHRDVLGLAERGARRVEQRGRAIPPLLDVGGIAGADQRLAHLLGDGRERGADHLDGDGVERRRRVRHGAGLAHASSNIRLR